MPAFAATHSQVKDPRQRSDKMQIPIENIDRDRSQGHRCEKFSATLRLPRRVHFSPYQRPNEKTPLRHRTWLVSPKIPTTHLGAPRFIGLESLVIIFPQRSRAATPASRSFNRIKSPVYRYRPRTHFSSCGKFVFFSSGVKWDNEFALLLTAKHFKTPFDVTVIYFQSITCTFRE